MKILKNISIYFLLVVITCGVVFFPQIISGQKEENVLNEVTNRRYYESSRPKLTSQQVARLFYEQGIGYTWFAPVNESNYAHQTYVTELIELLFESDEIICEPIKQILTDEKLIYFRDSSLIKIDNQPTSINFVTCERKTNPYFCVLYEEKTKTLIRMVCNGLVQEFQSTEEMQIYIEKVNSMIKNYYEKQLNMSKYEYFCDVEIPAVTMKSEKVYLANVNISCGLAQSDDKIIYEEDVYTIKVTD